MRYDAAIIGAGGNGLAAAITLASAGLKTLVVDRATLSGGRLQTREFHPGFRASPFLDDVPALPPELFWRLGLARAGVVMAPPAPSVALWRDRMCAMGRGRGAEGLALLREAAIAIQAVAGRAAAEGQAAPPRFTFPGKPRQHQPWPGEDWALRSLEAVVAERVIAPDLRAHLIARALAGRACDPFLAGSALHLLVPDGGVIRGGSGGLAQALAGIAAGAGVEFACGEEVAEIRQGKSGVARLVLAGGREVPARAVISTLDLKQTFLSLLPWHVLPPPVLARVGHFRMGGGTARVLFALEALPNLPAKVLRSTIHVAPDVQGLADAHAAWRAGIIPDAPHVQLRFVSASDPGLAPEGRAVMTATLGAIPYRLFDGSWTHEKREILEARARAAAALVCPELADRVIATQVIAPPDIEAALGATDGDLWGGEITSDQMFGWRPWPDCAPPRTPLRGLYLGGRSTAAGLTASCVAGAAAAQVVIGDLKAGRLR